MSLFGQIGHELKPDRGATKASMLKSESFSYKLGREWLGAENLEVAMGCWGYGGE